MKNWEECLVTDTVRPSARSHPSAPLRVLWCGVSALIWPLMFGCGARQSSELADSRPAVADVQMAPAASEPPDESGDSSKGEPAGNDRGNSVLEYALDRPSQTISLPEVLREISDITALSQSEIACVQDERGIVFVYDLNAKRITDEIHFASHGDYEGLAVVGSEAYVLRSDGVLFQLSSLKRHPPVRKIELNLPFKESEGLCLDEHHNRLLIAPKTRAQSDKEPETRPIFAFDLQRQTILGTPVFDIRLRDIRRFAKHHDLPIPRRPKKNGESMHNALHFLPSAIAVNPVSGELFVVSAVDHVVVSCTDRGTITGYALLDATTFRQPEGIAFMPNGDLLIANEAAGKVATLVVIPRKHPTNSNL